MEPSNEYQIENWGLIDYTQALKKQEECLIHIADKDLPGQIILCSHPQVVTLGRATKPGDVFSWEGPTVEISRGGRATYHGPSQLVVYPILNLNHAHGLRPAKDIGALLRGIETAIVGALAEYHVKAEGRSLQKNTLDETASEETGVWIGKRKIASLGIGVKRWVSFHGAAINLDYDANAFQGLNPCGFKSSTMISLEELIHKKVDREQFIGRLKLQLQLHL